MEEKPEQPEAQPDGLPTEPDPVSNRFKSLTATQLDVARKLAMGMTCREIAESRECSVKTIDTHRAAVLKALKVRNTVELARLAIAELEVPPPRCPTEVIP